MARAQRDFPCALRLPPGECLTLRPVTARERRPRAGAAERNGNDREQIGDDHRPTAGADRGGAGHKSVENSK
jgi:hypothetical protein